ncbi:MAG: DUF1573 domain-containing protein [Candidatus Omnitrophota bacterium]
MKRIFLILLFLSVTSAGCFAGFPPPEPDIAAPVSKEAAVEPPVPNNDPAAVWAFGQIKEGAIFNHTFVFKNDTAKILTIKDVNTSCGCTASQVKNKVLAAGEKTDIDVSFNSKGYSGPVEQFIFVNTDNIDKPVVKYAIKAIVIK